MIERFKRVTKNDQRQAINRTFRRVNNSYTTRVHKYYNSPLLRTKPIRQSYPIRHTNHRSINTKARKMMARHQPHPLSTTNSQQRHQRLSVQQNLVTQMMPIKLSTSRTKVFNPHFHTSPIRRSRIQLPRRRQAHRQRHIMRRARRH